MALSIDHVFTAHGGKLVASYGPRRLEEEEYPGPFDARTWIGCEPRDAQVWSVFLEDEESLCRWVADVDSEAHARMLARCLILSCGFCINEEC